MTVSARTRILDALEEQLLAQAGSTITLEAVASAADVSKGGLLYHFPSKSALIEGLAERLRETTETRFAEATEHGIVRTYLRSSAPDSPESATYRAMLIAGRDFGSEVSQRAKEQMDYVCETWRSMVHDAVADPVLATTICLVGDGLCLAGITDLPRPDLTTVQQVTDRLVDQATP